MIDDHAYWANNDEAGLKRQYAQQWFKALKRRKAKMKIDKIIEKVWQVLNDLFSKPEAVKPEKHLRICIGCNQQIKRAHRWRHVEGKPKHWNCDFPEKVLPAYLHKLVTEEEA